MICNGGRPELAVASRAWCGAWQAEQQERQRQEEEAFRAATMQRMAEEDRLEQLSAQRRREKTIVHRREVERLLQHRRALFFGAMGRLTPPPLFS